MAVRLSMTASQRERRAKEIVQQSGADTVEHFERVVCCGIGVTFKEDRQSLVRYDERSQEQARASIDTPHMGRHHSQHQWSTSAICRWRHWWTTRRRCGISSKRCPTEDGSPKTIRITCRWLKLWQRAPEIQSPAAVISRRTGQRLHRLPRGRRATHSVCGRAADVLDRGAC